MTITKNSSNLRVNVLIVGAGLGGLALGINLIQKGHAVTILEAAPKLGEVGAGIQVPPNSVKLLSRMGVYEKFATAATWPSAIAFKRWQDGTAIGTTPLLPVMEETYGYPYWLIHRGDFHRILYERALELGVTVKVGCPVRSVNESVPSVTLANGAIFKADLIIGADGIKSQVRRAVITDHEVKIFPDPNCAYRTLVPAEEMLKDEELVSLIKSPAATCWIGHEGHVMAYPIRQGTLYNFVMCHPGSVAVGKQNEPASLDDMRTKYKTWDPVLTHIIDKVPQCLKWQNAEIEKIETWISTSGKVALMGDAAHAMVPYMAQGAAMAMEDAVCISECLDRAHSLKDIPILMKLYEQFRMDRCYTILDGARNNGAIWHLPDGPEQRARDERMKKGSNPRKPSLPDDGGIAEDNPNKWSDPKFQPWMFGFDATEDTNRRLDAILRDHDEKVPAVEYSLNKDGGIISIVNVVEA